MTEPATAVQPPPAAPSPKPRTWLRWAIPAATLVVGIGIGAAAATTDPTSSEEYQALEQRLDTEEKRTASAQEAAERAGNNAAAASRSAAQQATELATRERLVTEREQAVGAVEQRIAETSIPNGIWTVGVDVEPGTYRTSAALTGYCYWGIYTSGTNGDDIIENDGPTGGFPTVTLREGQDFENGGCGTFVKQ
ncbi:hypothetical protein [Geodermatophilus chilensis]|jgi:uncharacterized membrane-anchored protein YhcB (DUF1043 family)|uniref:hypothetical protein n=1 Tax=Geodermatophilus chilensis TaxID=2035835 RepID=UPI000C266983|nr:hypothetical protein [Geodermatophilus chilensis]